MAAALAGLRANEARCFKNKYDHVFAVEPAAKAKKTIDWVHHQLLWGGVVTGQDIVSIEVTVGAVPYDGDLVAFADDTVQRALAMWRGDGVLDAVHTTPFGDLPGSVVIGFPAIDALAHAWDLSVSVGRPIEFAEEARPAISTLVEAVCTDDVRALDLIASPTAPPADATDTELLMALAGREVPR